MPDIEDTTEGGVFMPDELKNSEETASIIGFVMKVGESAYSDKSRFQMVLGAKRATLLFLDHILEPVLKFTGKNLGSLMMTQLKQ